MTPPIRRTFPGQHDQVACARDFVRRMAGCSPVLDDAVLLTSELCTNALQHTASANGGSFEVTVYRSPDSLRVEVRDDGAKTEPTIHAIEDMQENGRGLEIVALIAHRWGQSGDEYGRTVFFELRWSGPDRPQHQPIGAQVTINKTDPSDPAVSVDAPRRGSIAISRRGPGRI